MIFSTETDISTNDVLDWIYFLYPGIEACRKNNIEIDEFITIKLSNDAACNHSKKHWYRRGKLIFNSALFSFEKGTLLDLIYQRNRGEAQFAYDAYVDFLFSNNQTLNSYSDNYTNKIVNLRRALDCNLLIPETIVSNKMSEIMDFILDDDLYVIKDIAFDPFQIPFDDYEIIISFLPRFFEGKKLRETLHKGTVQQSKGFLFVQQYIEKKLELRCFFLNKKLYTMAIFSQSNSKTKHDYRGRPEENLNRLVPFTLPKEIENKLISFMSLVKMESGSIDMIYTAHGEFVFLEVNPVGEFQWLSRNCNYDIERSIAQFLIAD